MSEEQTKNLGDGQSFEERVFARFDVMDARLNDIDTRLQVLESKAYDTKPIWERAIKEIVDMRREFTKRLDRVEAVTLETRAGLRDVEDRLDRLESTPAK
ncbi:MAG TPA: hypothetical protein VLJ61_11055 [Pyrinomonadaceae bacterium]|nr:hypothetical protein [Pyrinomonadaceae bacterium]